MSWPRGVSGAALTLCVALVLGALSGHPVRADGGSVQVRTFKSAALESRRTYRVYLPPGYAAEPSRLYPHITVLHGLGGSGQDWFSPTGGDLDRVLDSLIAAGTIEAVIVIAPDGGNGYWTDHHGGKAGARFGAFIKEVEDHAASSLRLDPTRRGIAGVSMGGHGALSAGLGSPERYGAIVALAAAFFPDPPTHRPVYKRVWGDPPDIVHWRATAPSALARSDGLAGRAPPIWLQCGEADAERFLPWNRHGHRLLEERGFDTTLVISAGGHSWTSWRPMSATWLPWMLSRM